MRIRKWTYALLILAAVEVPAKAQARAVKDASGTTQNLKSIGDALDSPDHHPVHILYVHGIDQIGAGDSTLLRESICTRLKLCDVSDWKNAGIEYADKGEFDPAVRPPALAYLGSLVWNNDEEWHAAAPFVVHWVVHLRGHASPLEVDEINWWPLALALKCRRVMVPEAYLAGPDRQLLQVCSQSAQQDPGGLGRFYPWIEPNDADRLAKIRPRGALVNRTLKNNLVDWGLADVLMAVGPMGGLMRDGIRQLMAKSAAFVPAPENATPAAPAAGSSGPSGTYDWKSQLNYDSSEDQEFIGVTHSLGSYLLFNTLSVETLETDSPTTSAQDAARIEKEENALRYIFERTSLMYFFANQLQMLEITNLENAPQPAAGAPKSRGLAPAPPAPMNPAANFESLVNKWKQMQTSFQAGCHPNDEPARKKIQVVAWSDPSDVISFRVPRIGDVDVVNLYVKNAARWFGLFESPSAAHGNYARNKQVLKTMFEDTGHEGK
jgi:hypothetical protein